MDPQLLAIINQLDEFTRQQLRAYNNDIEEAIRKHTRGKDIVDQESLNRDIMAAAVKWGALFAAGLITYNALAARRSVNKDNERLKRILIYHGANKEALRSLDQARDRTAGLIEDTVLNRRWPGTNKNLTDRLKTVRDGSERVVRNIISLGIKDGKSSWQIAKEIEAYVIPNDNGLRVAPWTITRRELGRPTSYIPRGVPAGSVEYNAMRIARTETAYTYQQAPYLAHKDKWYYNGTLWVLSRSHPKVDICDEYAAHDEGIGIGMWRKPPPTPHPHCLCHTQTKTIGTDEMLDWLEKLNWKA